MTARALTLLGHDLRLQYRYGIYYAYAFVLVFYVGVLIYAAPWLPAWVVGFLVYSDPAVVGFFFLGALMMLERSEMSRMALAVTPLEAGDYLVAKSASLGALAVAASVLLAALSKGPVDWLLFVPAVTLTALSYLWFGVPIARRFRTATGYLIGSAGYLLPLVLPAALAFLDPMPRWAMVWPPAAQLKLLIAGLESQPLAAGDLLVLFAAALAGLVLTGWLALAALRKEFGRP